LIHRPDHNHLSSSWQDGPDRACDRTLLSRFPFNTVNTRIEAWTWLSQSSELAQNASPSGSPTALYDAHQ
jgi:hypothetical protein